MPKKKKPKMHAIGEQLNAAADLTNPVRIEALRKWKEGVKQKKEALRKSKEERTQ